MKNFPKIPPEEFKLRIQSFKEIMDRENIDLVMAYSNLLDPSAVRYFSDFYPIVESAAIIIPLKGDPILCSGQACSAWSKHKAESKIDDIRVFPEVGEISGAEYDLEGQLDFSNMFEELRSKYDIKKIGTIGDIIFPHSIYKKLENVFPDVEKVSAEALIYELRKIKSANEIECIKKASQIMDDTFEYAIQRIKPGVTELDIQADIEGQMLRLGAEAHCIGFAPMAPSGLQNTNLIMNRNTLRKVKESEIINPASGTLYEGYNAVICTPVVLGKIPTALGDAIKVCHEVKNYQAAAMKPGITSQQLFKIYNDYLEKKGYIKFLSPYGAAHSTGLLECESPCFQDSNLDILMEENMALCIDAFLTGLPGGSLRIEDTYIIRKDGAELLTKFNQEYIPETFN